MLAYLHLFDTLWAMIYEATNPVIVGTQWGDEGKGKGTNSSDTDMYGRGQGGNNAGHTFVGLHNEEVNTHLLPSGVNLDGKMNIIGHGTYADGVALVAEIAEVKAGGYPISPANLALSSMAHIVSPRHIALDELREGGDNGQGSTKRGIAFVGADKFAREGKRVIDFLNNSSEELYAWAYEGLRTPVVICRADETLATVKLADKETAQDKARQFVKAGEFLKPFIAHTPSLVQERLALGQTITCEGAQAFGLDINLGNYPNVTSAETLVPAVATGLGLNHKQIGEAIGAAKAIQSKVGGGRMPTQEDHPEAIDILRGPKGAIDSEYGKSTGRARSVGYLDLVLLKAAAEANGLDKIILNKVDTLRKIGQLAQIDGHDGRLRACVAYELDGKETTRIPEHLDDFERCTPVYEYFDSFSEDISGETNYSKLPKAVKRYVEFCADYVGVPFAILGTGPANHHAVHRN